MDDSSAIDHTTRVQQRFVQHVAEITYFVLSLVPNPSEADDVVQETFLTVTAKANDFTDGTNFKAWVFAIARFKIREHWRKQNRESSRLSDAAIELLAAEAAEGEETRDDPELAGALAKCLKKLAPKARLLVESVYRDGMKPREAAGQVGWTANAVYVALSRARLDLRNCLRKQLGPGAPDGVR